MPAFTVTAFDTTANTLTATGVAAAGGALGTVLLTGDRFRLRNIGGALPAATPALAAVTDFFAIRVDDNTIKAATSNANAMAGTAIDITGSGSGTTMIEFGLPYCVPRIMAQGVQLFSRDISSDWQAMVALYDLLTGQAQNIFNGVTLASNQHLAVLEDRVLTLGPQLALVTSGTPSFALSNISFPGNGSMVFAIPLRVGDVIKSYALNVAGDNTVDVTLQFVKLTPSTNSQVIVDTTTFNNVPNNSPSFNYNALSVNPTDQVIGPDDWFMVNASWTGVSSNVFISSLKVTYNSP